MKTYLYTLSLLLCLISCKGDISASDIDYKIKSGNTNELVEAAFYIGEQKLTQYIPFLLSAPDDQRISHHYRYKGISVYQSKMTALKKISGLKSPAPITYRKDTTVINYYRQWAKAQNYIR